MIHTGSEIDLEPGMVFFLLMILVDGPNARTMSVGETVIVGDQACETLSRVSTDLVVN